jgi:membrane-bound serine protease (ClpP class)
MFLPGGVLGALGGMALLGAVILGYVEFGPIVGTVMCGAIASVVLIGFCAWMAAFPRTAVGRKLTLGSALSSGSKLPDATALVDLEGIAITPLRPAGTARIGDRRVDVVAEGAFIASGEAIVVTVAEGARIVVRKKG